MRISRRTVAKVETWLDKQKIGKLRKMLIEGWVYDYEPREVEDLTDEEVRAMMLEDVKSGPGEQADMALESVGIPVEYSDDEEADDDDDDDDLDEEE